MIVLEILKKDILLSWRKLENFLVIFVFSNLLFIIYQFSFFEIGNESPNMKAGAFWSVFVIIFVYNLQQIINLENTNSCIRRFFISPISKSEFFLGKFFSILFYNIISFSCIFPIYAVFFAGNSNLNLPSLFAIITLTLIGTSSIGTLLCVVTNEVRLNQLLMPVILFPLMIPVILSAIFLTVNIFEGSSFSLDSDWSKLLIGFDLIFFTVSLMLSDFIE